MRLCIFSLLSRIALGGLVCLLAISALSPARAQDQASDALRVLVQVDDQPITVYDVVTRLALNQALVDGPQNEPAVLQALIDEAIANTTAAQRGIIVDDAAVQSAFAELANNNGISQEVFAQRLTDINIPLAGFLERLRGQIVWNNVLNSIFGAQIRVSDEDLEAAWADLQRDRAQGQQEWLLTEIVLVNEGLDAAQELADDLREGGNLADLVTRHSTAPTVAQDGNLGWVRPSELDPTTRAAVESLTAGEVSAPLAQDDTLRLLIVRDVRPVGSMGLEVSVDLQRLFITLEAEGQSPADSQKIVTLDQAFRSVRTCTDFQRAVQLYGEPGSGSFEGMQVSTLPPAVREAVADTPVNGYSPLIAEPGGASIYAVCRRDTRPILITQDQLRNRLRMERAEESSQDLRIALRRNAYIDYR